MLDAITIKNIENPADKPKKHYDAGGLYLEATKAGGRHWYFKFRFDGKEGRLAIGAYPLIGLAEARKQRDKAKALLAHGVDPSAEKKARKGSGRPTGLTFKQAFEAWYETWKIGKSPRHAKYVLDQMKKDVVEKSIGDKSLSEISTVDIVNAIKEVEKRGVGDLARRLLFRTKAVFAHAMAHGDATTNPAVYVDASQILKPVVVTHMKRINANELPALIRKIDDYDQGFDGEKLTMMALQLMALTFVRTEGITGSTWDEFDLDQSRWTIPLERMKLPTPHIVPLAAQTVALLAELKACNFHEKFLFPGALRGTMSNNTMLYALYRMGYRGRMTGHGFRGLASTILHEAGFPHEHIELQLAHQERSSVSAAYNYALYLEPRTKMMQWWADHIDKARLRE